MLKHLGSVEEKDVTGADGWKLNQANADEK